MMLHFCYHMRAEIECHDPAFVFFYFIVPIFVIAFIIAMKDEDVFTDEDEFIDTRLNHWVYEFFTQGTDVVADGIVPFAHHFYDGKALFVVGIKHLAEKRFRVYKIPLMVDDMVVNAVRVVKFAVAAAVKRRQFVV